ncbi:MAG TPA: zf-HC2 domain-containing protein [Pyrinomonadaceae bacterium]|nr:zf-HC2 domain-containing protein [Pyrinomonadaceae bacterium]
MKRCLDESLLQAYMDGELSPEQAGAAAAHLAACETCADALASAQSEASFFASAFAPDESVSVPTEILRARVNAAVARLESSPETTRGGSRGWSFGGFLASLSGMLNLTPQGAAAFAGLLAVLTVATVLFVVQKSQRATRENEIAQTENTKPTTATPSEVAPNQNEVKQQPVATPESGDRRTIIETVKYTPRSVNKKNAGRGRVAPPAVKDQSLPGEKDYQTAIASLEKTIKMGGDAVLSPSVRLKYERNVAILDSAIGESRRVAAANPKDKDAVGFLMAAYQSKVELLTKVADQAQVAAVGR